MKINCPFCEQPFEIKASMIDKEVQCSKCGHTFFAYEDMIYDKDTDQTESPREEPNVYVADSKEDMPLASHMEPTSGREGTKTTLTPLTCEMCGSTDIVKQNGVFVCQACGTKYSVEDAKKMMLSGPSGKTGKVVMSEKLSNLYTIARRAKTENNDKNAAKYYELILQEDPNSWEASFYSVYYKAMGCKIAEISSAASSVASSLKSVFPLINEYVESPEERESAAVEICNSSLDIANMLTSAAKNHYNEIDSQIRDKFEQEYENNMVETISIWFILGDQLEQFASYNPTMTQDILKYAVLAWKSAIVVTNNTFDQIDQAEMENSFFSVPKYVEKIKKIEPGYQPPAITKAGCYIATAVYGSYDCPQVWTLRRYRDDILASSFFGRIFIHIYYAISPTLVRCFGGNTYFKRFWKRPLDRLVYKLHEKGVSNAPYQDRKW